MKVISNNNRIAVILWPLSSKNRHPKDALVPVSWTIAQCFSHSSPLLFLTCCSLQMSHSNRNVHVFDMCQHHPEKKMLDCFTGTHSTKNWQCTCLSRPDTYKPGIVKHNVSWSLALVLGRSLPATCIPATFPFSLKHALDWPGFLSFLNQKQAWKLYYMH